MRKIIVKILYIIYALKKINKPHLGDVVIFNTIECVIVQGVANPYYDLLVLEGTSGILRINNIHKTRFKLANPITGSINRFKESYKFKMQNWFLIDTWNKSLFSPISNVG